MIKRPLDIDAVQAFVNIAAFGSFTRTAIAMRTTQSAISLKLKRLEEKLGYTLVERTPRRVQLSKQGALFLDHAQELLEAHDRAISCVPSDKQRLSIGISDHVAGPELPALISRMNAHDPKLIIEIRIATSSDLLLGFDHRELDAVLVRFDKGRDDGERIAQEKFRWFASPEWQLKAGEPLPLATMPEPCGVRNIASELLDDAGISWSETFVGGGIAAVSAAVIAGLGVAALAPRMLPMGALDVGRKLGLPELPRLPVMLHSHVSNSRSRQALDVLSAAFQSIARD